MRVPKSSSYPAPNPPSSFSVLPCPAGLLLPHPNLHPLGGHHHRCAGAAQPHWWVAALGVLRTLAAARLPAALRAWGPPFEQSSCLALLPRLLAAAGEALGPLFADPNVVKVLHGADGDIVWLQARAGAGHGA